MWIGYSYVGKLRNYIIDNMFKEDNNNLVNRDNLIS